MTDLGRRKTAFVVAAVYVVLAACSIGYELSVRLYDRGNSEFAGMLSTALTLPSSVVVFSLIAWVFGIRVGDSDVTFVTILGLAAIVNAAFVLVIAKKIWRTS